MNESFWRPRRSGRPGNAEQVLAGKAQGAVEQPVHPAQARALAGLGQGVMAIAAGVLADLTGRLVETPPARSGLLQYPDDNWLELEIRDDSAGRLGTPMARKAVAVSKARSAVLLNLRQGPALRRANLCVENTLLHTKARQARLLISNRIFDA